LKENEACPNPFDQFRLWFEEAVNLPTPHPTAMTLATATPDGKPSARIVLLKGFDERGFVFFTNYASRKGRELDSNPHAALVFFWPELEHQIRIEGRVERVSAEESDRYFQSRPRESQLGACASAQSEVVESRDVLDRRFQELVTRYPAGSIPRPACWGGYRLVPSSLEFWQGRTNRLHDRLRYDRSTDGTWRICRLSP
jgi:pyridoxamine 5'-phosphate oxidase